jgi:signal transduction histidine kinase
VPIGCKLEEAVKKTLGALSAALAIVLLFAGGPARAEDHGSASEAKAMLERAVAALTRNEAKALVAFSNGEDGFKDRDLYVFCARRDGRVDAHIDHAQIGRKLQDLYDIDGVAFGQEMMAIARRGEFKAISYMWPKPGSREPAEKVSFITRVADQICGVGYYK